MAASECLYVIIIICINILMSAYESMNHRKMTNIKYLITDFSHHEW